MSVSLDVLLKNFMGRNTHFSFLLMQIDSGQQMPGWDLSRVFIAEWMFIYKYHFIRVWNYFIIEVSQSQSQSLPLQPLVEGGVQCCNIGGCGTEQLSFSVEPQDRIFNDTHHGQIFHPTDFNGITSRARLRACENFTFKSARKLSLWRERGQITAS